MELTTPREGRKFCSQAAFQPVTPPFFWGLLRGGC
jgi:hypothetical protein